MRCIFCNSTQHTYRHCPINYKKTKRTVTSIKKEYTGETPNIFIGTYGYPKVNVGILNTEQYTDQDDHKTWTQKQYSINQIIEKRTELINARDQLPIKTNITNRYLDLIQEIGRAKKKASIDVTLKKAPKRKTFFDTHSAPRGPNAALKKVAAQSNIKTNHHIEKAASDTDLKATNALSILQKKGIEEHHLVRALSTGNFGIKNQRKLVPTRWSITAVDDTLGKQLINTIKDNPETNIELYQGQHHGNYFYIIFFDEVWQYELFEQFKPRNAQKAPKYETDYEPYAGRKQYAEETAGGYYASRLPILEKLKEKKRQSSVLVIRIITEEYTAPLGVWVVREAVRKAMNNNPIQFNERKLAIEYMKKTLQQKHQFDCTKILQNSKLLNTIKNQTKLKSWF